MSDLTPGPSSNEIAGKLGWPLSSATNVIATNSPSAQTNVIAGTNSIKNPAPPNPATNAPAVSLAPSSSPVKNEYEENAFALTEGQMLYNYFNCVGCHAHGGGGIGPALMDDEWIYGHNPEQIFATIVQGRPNGMPSFQGRIPDYQVWQLAAYVRSMSGLVPKDAAPGRTDHMAGPPPPNSKKQEQPKNSTLPKSAEMP
jgi:cytochrome c oxidase cbb3-type subunit 3